MPATNETACTTIQTLEAIDGGEVAWFSIRPPTGEGHMPQVTRVTRFG